MSVMPAPNAPSISTAQRAEHLRWLHEVTQIPTAAGREQRVISWVRLWAKARRGISLVEDAFGNLHLYLKDDPLPDAPGAKSRRSTKLPRPVYFTAHLDHPAFVVERIIAPGVLELSFRGGVMADYFNHAHVVVHDSSDSPHRGTITSVVEGSGEPFKNYIWEMAGEHDENDAFMFEIGDVGVWDLPPAEIIGDTFHTLACDDLAALVAALAAFDVLRERRSIQSTRRRGRATPTLDPIQPVRLLLTRAEEIGFIGAIGAVRLSKEAQSARARRPKGPHVPRNSRVLALENSRSFPDSPIGGGPIVRVGDRLSIFSPSLTDAVAKRAEEYASQFGGAGTQPTAQQKLSEGPQWKWQRKLMAGGACEASVFCHAGLEATCVCLPLGNYHNMGDLANVQAGTNADPPTIAREFIGVSDFEGLVDLLVACGERLPEIGLSPKRFDKLWQDKKFVLD